MFSLGDRQYCHLNMFLIAWSCLSHNVWHGPKLCEICMGLACTLLYSWWSQTVKSEFYCHFSLTYCSRTDNKLSWLLRPNACEHVIINSIISVSVQGKKFNVAGKQLEEVCVVWVYPQGMTTVLEGLQVEKECNFCTNRCPSTCPSVSTVCLCARVCLCVFACAKWTPTLSLWYKLFFPLITWQNPLQILFRNISYFWEEWRVRVRTGIEMT